MRGTEKFMIEVHESFDRGGDTDNLDRGMRDQPVEGMCQTKARQRGTADGLKVYENAGRKK